MIGVASWIIQLDKSVRATSSVMNQNVMHDDHQCV